MRMNPGRMALGSNERVRKSSPVSANVSIKAKTKKSLSYYARHPELIEKRLGELDREWDIERILAVNAAIAMLAGLTVGLRRRSFLIFPAFVAGFLLQHAVQGWCPPLPVFRKMGARTADEILREKTALQSLRI